MSSLKLTGSEKRALALWLLAGIVGVFFAHRYFLQAFPEASVDFKVNRPQALARAKAFAAGLGENLDSYRSAIEFSVEENEKVYVEREVGLQQANQLASSKINLWYWNVRFYKPQQEEEFEVRVSPSGQIVGYKHVVPEARAGATLERGAAQTLAQNFLTAQLGKPAVDWTFLPEEANSQKKPSRLDWDFTWENKALKVKDAPYREKIHVTGDKPGGASEGLLVPETWQRSYERLRSGNNTLAFVFTVPYFGILAVAVWVAITFTKNGQTKWALAVKLGAIAAAALFLQGLNDWPLWGSSYDTKDAYAGFLVMQVLRALGIAVVTALTISLVLPAAEPLYRQSQPNNLRFAKLLTWRGIRSKEFFSSAVVGISLAAAHIGFVVLFYAIVTRFGAWAPQEVNYSDAVNTGFPWISGVAIGLLASMNEEFTFRLFAIPFFTRFTRSQWIAIIVPAFLWGFLHSNYPQEPAYIRGVEVGLIGIVAGIVMLRYGILSTLIWHYTVDASLVGLFLVRSDNFYFKVSGVVVGLAAAAPLLFSLASYLKRGQFEAVDDLQNAAEPVPELKFESAEKEKPRALSTSRYHPLGSAAIGVLAICAIFGAVAAVKLKQERIGDYLKLSVSARQAVALSDVALQKRGVDLSAFHRATLFLDNSDPAANEFLRERIGVAAVNKLYASEIPIGLWGTRYFKDGDPEEYFVVLRPDGALHSLHHTIAENTAGAALTKEAAVALAEKYLKEEKNLDLTGWSLADSESKKRPHRIDHTLTWQQSAPLDARTGASGSAFARIEVKVMGDEVTGYRSYVKIPEEWSRKQEEQGLSRTLYFVGSILALVALGAVMLVIYFQHFRGDDARSIPWKRISIWAAWSLGGFVLTIAFGDRIAAVFQQYQTAVPLKMWYLITAISFLLGGAFSVGALILVFGLAWFYCRKAFGEERLPNWFSMPGVYYRDALLIGIGGVFALAGLQSVLGRVGAHYPVAHRFASIAFSPDFSAKFPAAAIVGAAISHALLYSALVAAIGGFVVAYVKPWALRLPIFLVGAATLVRDWGSAGDFAEQYLFKCIFLAVVAFGVGWIARLNLLGIFLAIFSSAVASSALALLEQANPFYRGSAYAVLALLAVVLAWPLIKWRTAAAADPA
ncbi:MAG TPA: CPBP family intramembrane glutamic endopeptidase [Candidatus Acidoferrum sp.]|nr:CPBP family intramembrane glutamic endopeptidase [Candidatus Acidoferrum sp.]